MGFTVTRPNGLSDAEFPDYARVVRQTGVDLGRLPRVLDPKTGRRWLYYPETEEKTQVLLQDLKERSFLDEWEVVEVNGPASEGPLGPVVIPMLRDPISVSFSLHVLSRAMIGSAFPSAFPKISSVLIDEDDWTEFFKRDGKLSELVREVAPLLTGLTLDELERLGFVVLDDITHQATLSVVPRSIHGAPNGTSSEGFSGEAAAPGRSSLLEIRG